MDKKKLEELKEEFMTVLRPYGAVESDLVRIIDAILQSEPESPPQAEGE